MTDQPAQPVRPIVLVAVGGDPTAPVALPVALGEGSVVVAADAGVDRLVAAGLGVHHVVGDLDSASPAALAVAREGGATVHRHPADKDATDLELALALVVDELAPAAGLDEIVVIGPGGGRLDLLLGDVALVCGPRLAACTVTARLGPATVTVVRPGSGRTITGPVGAQVSLLPVHGPADGVTTTGLRWVLDDAHLAPGTTRGLSNELVTSPATVRLASGVVAVVQPGVPAPPVAPRATPYDPTPKPNQEDRP